MKAKCTVSLWDECGDNAVWGVDEIEMVNTFMSRRIIKLLLEIRNELYAQWHMGKRMVKVLVFRDVCVWIGYIYMLAPIE